MKEVDPYEFETAIMLLDACKEALNLAADTEAKSHRGGLREITHQMRAKAVREFVMAHSDWLQ